MPILGPIVLPANDLRPQYHFTAPKGWLNDPNGLVYENGKYHLFYQHNPFGTQWGNMTWGHAVSRDLIHWEHLPNALMPDKMGTMYSGSAVIDKANTSGLGSKDKPAIVCLYTAAGGENDLSKGQPYTQCLAWSQDGKTFTKLAGNPIVKNLAAGNRDPKVFWHAPSNQWVMALYLKDDSFAILGSPNLTQWSLLSELQLQGSSECPDLFQLPLDGDSKKMQWIFWGANGFYRVGTFDGKEFKPTTPILHSYHGNTAYAGQTYSNAPKNRCIQISWFNNSNFPNSEWNQQMSVPNVLTLRTTPSGPALAFQPVDEVKSIRGPKIKESNGLFAVPSGILDFEADWKVPASGTLKLQVNGVDIEVSAATKKLTAHGREATLDLDSGTLNLRILADRTSIEIYAQKGLMMMPLFVLPKEGAFQGVTIQKMGEWKGSAKVYELKLKTSPVADK